jgi:hypothetical protein
MKTIETNLYSFNELSKTAQTYAIEKYKETSEIDLDLFKDDCEQILKDKNITLEMLRYSFSYSQGDGLSFSATFDIETMINNCFTNLSDKRKKLFQNFIYKVESVAHKRNYAYASKSDIEITINYNNFDYEKHSNINNMLNTFENYIQDLYMTICNEFKNNGYNEIENQNSVEYISEILQDNDDEFTENGKKYVI